tara:strand:- start:131728 stop:131934 length:207 start_codon:yes stop_codon:yes gene_type:complete
MKALELNQMENLKGGSALSCFGAVAGLVSLTALAIAGGPVGWFAWGAAIGSGMSTGFALGDCVYDATH